MFECNGWYIGFRQKLDIAKNQNITGLFYWYTMFFTLPANTLAGLIVDEVLDDNV